MKTYCSKDAPLKVFGIPFFDTKKAFRRLPYELIPFVLSMFIII